MQGLCGTLKCIALPQTAQSAEMVPATLASDREGSHHYVPMANDCSVLGIAPYLNLLSSP